MAGMGAQGHGMRITELLRKAFLRHGVLHYIFMAEIHNAFACGGDIDRARLCRTLR